MIHIVRGTKPAPTPPELAPEDTVVYVECHDGAITWRTKDGEPLAARAVIELLCRADRAIVW